MNVRTPLSRRRFFGGVAATVGAMTVTRSTDLFPKKAATTMALG